MRAFAILAIAAVAVSATARPSGYGAAPPVPQIEVRSKLARIED